MRIITDSKKRFWIIIAILTAIVLPNLINSAYLKQIMVVVMMYAFLTTAWNICGGYAGQIGLGNGVYIGIGAYMTGVFFNELHLSPWIGMIIAALVAGLISIGIGSFTFKLRGTYYSLATVALLNIIRILLNENQYIFSWDFGGPAGLKIPWLGSSFINMQFMDKSVYYYIIFALLLLALWISNYINKSRPGFYYKAIDTNQEAAASLGVNVIKYKLQAQFLSAFLMGIGGGFYMMFYMYVDTVSMFGSELSFETLLLAIVGGRATLMGPTIAAFLLIPFNELLRRYLGTTLPGLPTMLYGLMLMVSIQFMPQGVIPLITEKIKRKKSVIDREVVETVKEANK